MVYDDGEQLRSDQEERRREKFSRERGNDSFGERGGGRRNFGPPDRRDYSNGIGKKRSYRDDDLSGIQSKRSRFDGAVDSYEPQFIRKDPSTEQTAGGALPQMLTFKSFLTIQNETLTDEEAITKYKDYKIEFMRQDCERYFLAHKEEEWFRHKYHPEEGKFYREEQRANLQKRLELFNELISAGRFDDLAMSYDHAEQLIRMMDEVVIKMEDGTDVDIALANEEPLDDESVLDLLSPEQLEKRREDVQKQRAIEETETTTPRKKENPNVIGSTEITKNNDIADMQVDSTDQQMQLMPSKRVLPHKTRSIHFRSVPTTVPLAEIEMLCKQHPGFLRLAITEPQPNSKGQLMRMAWATYRWDVNIKQIYWALRDAKLNGVNLGASVNRDLKRRVRSIGSTNGLSSHYPVVRNDIRQAAKLVVLYDFRAGLYREEEAEEGEEELGQGESGGAQNEAKFADLNVAVLSSRNPLLAGIADYLVEESPAEEEALLEKAVEIDGSEIMQQMEENKSVIQVLDRLLLYLRIVHSVDYYAITEYQYENNMPYRLGLIHVRARRPIAALYHNWPCTDRGVPLLSKRLVDAHITTFNARLDMGLMKKVYIPESELLKYGKKDPEKAVEDFINTNTQQLAPDKWLCPLSGKKFKGAEFVHKHLKSKYQAEIDNTRYEALYLNAFLADPNRPHNPIFARHAVFTSPEQQERSRSPPSSRRPTTRENLINDESATSGREQPERIPYQRYNSQSTDRFSSGGGGSNRFSGGGRAFSGFGSGGQPRGGRFFETVNEMMPMGNTGVRRQDPRAPPSYRDLDAPAEDIL